MAQRVIFGCSDSVAQQAVQLSEFAELAPSRRPMQRWEWREGPFKQGWIILAADDLGWQDQPGSLGPDQARWRAMMQACRISCLELARLRYPNGKVTSGAGQDYLRKLDKEFPKGQALTEVNSSGRVYIANADETLLFNLSTDEAKRVIRKGHPELSQ